MKRIQSRAEGGTLKENPSSLILRIGKKGSQKKKKLNENKIPRYRALFLHLLKKSPTWGRIFGNDTAGLGRKICASVCMSYIFLTTNVHRAVAALHSISDGR